MHDQPSVSELVQAVKNFVDETAMTHLKGRAGFHARVASNVLGTVLRDLEDRAANEAEEKRRLTDLLQADPGESLDSLNRALQAKIRAGELTIQSQDLVNHLKMTAIAQIKVDQPTYSGLANALKE
ncbi:DUF6285 domain-containing protein [Henriciella aquimarina]|uniref:DUF6285 domain-containing protein n=1 Tax=Henriciella aquimarina TaxID=545261 RepID=UPI000A036463|nr:DUF6285 domain-containing protein [Henriciella aquimarina]